MSARENLPNWKQVADSPQFKEAPVEVRQAARQQFFDRYVKPNAQDDSVEALQSEFYTRTEPDVFGGPTGQEPAASPQPSAPSQPPPAEEPAGLQLPQGSGVVNAGPALEAAKGPAPADVTQGGGMAAIGRGFQQLGNRATDLAGNLVQGADTYWQLGEKALADAFGEGGGLMFGTTDRMREAGYEPDVELGGFGLDFAGRVRSEDTNIGLQEAGQAIEDTNTDVDMQYDVDRFLKDPSLDSVAGLVAEQGPAALVDMGAMAVTPFAYFVSRNQEIGEERAKNQGREGQPNAEDMVIGGGAAGASLALDRFALSKLLPGASRAISRFRQVPGAALKGGVAETGTEATQEVVEYGGEALGTEKGATLEEAGKRALGGALIGGPIGAGVRGATATAEAASNRGRPEITDAPPPQEEPAPPLEEADRMAAQAAGDLIRTPRSQLSDTDRELRDDAIYGDTFKTLRAQAQALGLDDAVADLDAASKQAGAALEAETLARSRNDGTADEPGFQQELDRQLDEAATRYTGALDKMAQAGKPSDTPKKPKPKVKVPKTKGMTEEERIAAWEQAWRDAGVENPQVDNPETFDVTGGEQSPAQEEVAAPETEQPAAQPSPTAEVAQEPAGETQPEPATTAQPNLGQPPEPAAQAEPEAPKKPRVRVTSEGRLRPGLQLPTEPSAKDTEIQPERGLDLAPPKRKTGGKPRVRVKQQIEQAAAETDTAPSEAQIESGNYKKGRVRLNGFEVTIENPKGSTRSGTDESGRQWESTMAAHYGDIKRTEAADGDNLDVFIGDNPESERVYVVDQTRDDGSFDEHKVIMGANSRKEAQQLYRNSYEQGAARDGAITETTVDELKAWMKDGDQKKPFGKLRSEKPRARPGQGKAGRAERQQNAAPGLVVRTNGTPFSTEKGAQLSRAYRENPGATVEPTQGGFAVRIPEATEATPASIEQPQVSTESAEVSTESPRPQRTERQQAVHDAVEPLRAEGLSVTVVDSIDELPADLRSDIRKFGYEEKASGVYHKGVAYVISSNATPEGAARTAVHETVGHGGLRAFLGEDLNATLDDIYKNMSPRSIAKYDWIYQEQVDNLSVQDARRLLAEEYIAHLAETNPQHTKVSRVVAKIRRWLRRVLGPGAATNWGREELVDLIANARLAAISDPARRQAADDAARFALDPDKDLARQAAATRYDLERAGAQVQDTMRVDELISSDKVKTLTLHDLVGMKVFPTIADRTAAAALYTGIDSSQVDVAIPLLGGPLFPLRESNVEAGVVWANRGKGVTSQKAANLKKGANYMMVVMGDANMHQSNTTVTNAFFSTLEAYARDKRITKKNSDALTKMVKGSKNADEKIARAMQAFPGVRDAAALDKYLHGVTFEARRRLLGILGSKKAQDLGAPSMTKILNATREPGLAGQRWGDGVLLVEVDQQSTQVDLGTEGTTPHPDFPLGIRGKVVGKMEAPINYELLWGDWLAQARKDAIERGTDEAKINTRRAFELSKPIVSVTQGLVDRIGPITQSNIDGPRQARLAADFATGNWKSSDDAVKQGGVSPQEFLDAIDNSEAAPTLTRPTLSELKKDIKSGKVKVYQLGDDGQIFFTLTRRDDGGLELGGVVNNEQGARGIGGPAVLLKALEEGATHLDAFAVTSEEYPNGFLPTLYGAFGFEATGRAPFNPKFMTKKQRDDAVQFWQNTTKGFDPAKGMPDVVFMEWRGTDEDRRGITRRYLEGGTQGLLAGGDRRNATAAASNDVSADREAAGGSQAANDRRAAGAEANGNQGSVASRPGRVVSSIARLSDNELTNLGLTPRDRTQVRQALGLDQAGPETRFALKKPPRIRRSIQELSDSAESMSDWRTWYDRHENALKRLFGDEAELFQQMLSATSQAAAVKPNVSLALKAYRQYHEGEPFTGYLPAVIKNLERIRDKAKLEGAKISQYGEANLGNEEAIAVDRHIAMLFFNTKTPSAPQIRAAKTRIRKVADRLGWRPREVQAALWAFNQVRLGSDPSKVQSYDTILEARADEIASLRAAFAGSEGEGLQGRGEAGPRTEEGAGGDQARYALTEGRDDDSRSERTRDGGGRSPRGADEALEGAPTVRGASGPDPELNRVAEEYARQAGIPYARQAEYAEVDVERAEAIAQAYEEMQHDPQDPEVREAYRDLIRQTRAQYDALVDAGYEFYFFDGDSDPYDGNPWNAMRDLRANKRMAVFTTEGGFGSDEAFDPAENPLLADTGLRWPLGSTDGPKRAVLANDLFRAVHDAFGHGLEGAGFRARGEENAWQAHARLFTGAFDPSSADIRYQLADDEAVDWEDVENEAAEQMDFDNYMASDSTNFSMPDETIKDQALRWFADKMRPLKLVQDAIRGGGGVVNDDNDVYLQETLFHGKTERDLKKLQDVFVKPLAEALGKSSITQAELDEYLYARHAFERNAKIAERNPDNPKMQDGGSGMTNAEADLILDRVAQSGQQDEYDALAEYVYAMLDARRQAIRDGGLEEDEVLDAWDEAYEFYVPLKGWAKDEDKPAGSDIMIRLGTGSGFEIKGGESRSALGRKTKAASPTTQAIVDTTQSMIRRRKNEVGQALLSLITDNPNPALWEVFTSENPDTQRAKATVRDPETGRKRTVVRERPVAMGQNPAYFKTKKLGRTFYIKIHDQRLMNAMRNVGPEQNSLLIRAMGSITRVMSALVTSYNPEFMVTNFARDIQTALFNVTAEQTRDDGKVRGKRIARQVAKDVMKSMRASHRGLTGRKAKTAEGRLWDQYFEEFLDDGAKTGYFDMKDIEGQAKEIRNLMRQAQGGTLGNLLKFKTRTGELVENINGAVENATRFSAYVNARRAGISRKRAADLAKNLTVNFNRRGEAGTALNAMFMFANASIQGTMNFARTVVTLNEGNGSYWSKLNTAQKIALGMTGGTFALSLFNRMISGEDDDEVLFYDKIPDHVKERNFIIMTGPDDYVRIPMPYGYNVFGVVGTQAEALVAGTKGPAETAKNLGLAVLGSFSPIGFDDSEEIDKVAMKNLTPTLFRSITQIAINEDFAGRPVYKENFPFGAQMPDSSLAFRSTPEPYQGIARFLNDLTGGSEWRSGAVDVSPDSIQHLINFYGGGAWGFTEKTADLTKRLVTGEEVERYRVPFSGRLYSEVSDYPDIQSFYERKAEVEQLFNEFENTDPDLAIDFYETHADKIDLKGWADDTAKTLTKLRQEREIVQSDDSLSREEKDEISKEIEEAMDAEVDLWNREYNRAQ